MRMYTPLWSFLYINVHAWYCSTSASCPLSFIDLTGLSFFFFASLIACSNTESTTFLLDALWFSLLVACGVIFIFIFVLVSFFL